MKPESITDADGALNRLKSGNRAFLSAAENKSDISPSVRKETAQKGQFPYAVIVACSDSRVVPEHIFGCGIGELFVIRVAGNVIGDHQLGSIEYAVRHLKCPLVVVLAHTGCGAVNAALQGAAEGYVRTIAEEIRIAANGAADAEEAARRNAAACAARIERALGNGKGAPKVSSALYRIESGAVEVYE